MKLQKRVLAIVLLVVLVAIAAVASKTYTFNVTNAGTGIAVVAQSDCDSITVYENTDQPTTGFEIRAPGTSDSAAKYPAGDRFTFATGGGGNTFAKGVTVGYVRLTDVAGPVSFAQVEHR